MKFDSALFNLIILQSLNIENNFGIVFDLFRVFFNLFHPKKRKTMQFIKKPVLLAILFSFALTSMLSASNEPIITAQPTHITQFVGGYEALKVAVSTKLTVVYQWQKSTDNSNWLSIQGATEASYTPQTLVAGKAWYRVLITTIEDNARAVASDSAEVMIRERAQTDLSVKK